MHDWDASSLTVRVLPCTGTFGHLRLAQKIFVSNTNWTESFTNRTAPLACFVMGARRGGVGV